MLGGRRQVLDAAVRVDDHDAVVHAESTQSLAAAHAAGDDQLARAGDGATEPRVAFALALVLDQQHLAAQRADDLAALVADGEDLLQDRRAADDRRGDLVARAPVEQDAEDQRRLLAGHAATERDRQRVRAGHGYRLRLGDDDHLVAGAGEEHGIGVGQVGQQRQVTGDAFEQRPDRPRSDAVQASYGPERGGRDGRRRAGSPNRTFGIKRDHGW